LKRGARLAPLLPFLLFGLPALAQAPQDVVLHPEIVSHNRNVRRGQGIPNGARVQRNVPAHQVEIGALAILRIPRERFQPVEEAEAELLD